MFDVLGDIVVDAGRQGQVEEPVGPGSSRQGQQVSVQASERRFIHILPADVRVSTEERSEALCLGVDRLKGGKKADKHKIIRQQCTWRKLSER